MKSYYILLLWLFFEIIYNKYSYFKSCYDNYKYNKMIKYLIKYIEKQLSFYKD